MSGLTSFRADDHEQLFVSIRGQGRPLVVLHGWTASHREWLFVQDALADQARVLCWDARGHGGHTPLTVNPPTAERMARDLDCLIRHYRLERPVLMGHSMGVLTLWEYVRRFGDGHLGGLCLIDQSPRLVTDDHWKLGIYGDFPESANRELIGLLKKDFPEGVIRLAALGLNQRALQGYRNNSPGFQRYRSYLAGLAPAPLIRCWESLSGADYREVLPTIRVPTLLIYGAESNFYGPETIRYVADHIPGARLEVYPGADHSPHLGQRERLIADLGRFLTEPPAGLGMAGRGQL